MNATPSPVPITHQGAEARGHALEYLAAAPGAATDEPLTHESQLLWSDPQQAEVRALTASVCGLPGEQFDPTQLTAKLILDARALARLHELWAACLAAEADEISEWTVAVSCQVTSAAETFAVPVVLAVSATVYADGAAHFEVVLDGAEQAVRLRDSLQLKSTMPRALAPSGS